MDSLTEIALRHGTDKVTDHSYTEFYEELLAARRHEPIRILEIGIGGYEDPNQGGPSLRMWKEYFPNGTIVGIDLYDKSGLAEDRITVVQSDQTDAAFLRRVVQEDRRDPIPSRDPGGTQG